MKIKGDLNIVIVRNLLVIVYSTVDFPVFDETATGKGHLAFAAMKTLFMPTKVDNSHQKSVLYRSTATGANLSLVAWHSAYK